MIRLTDFKKMYSQFDTDSLPALKGFGNSVVQVLGKRQVNVTVDEVEAEVQLFVVPDGAMQVPIMIGQTFTEQPHVVVYKTSDNLHMLNSVNDGVNMSVVKLFCKADTLVSGPTIVEVYPDSPFEGELYVEGGLRLKSDLQFTVSSGLFSVRAGQGNIVVDAPCDKPVVLNAGYLIARGRVAKEDNSSASLDVMRVFMSSVSNLVPLESADVKVGPELSSSEKEELVLLLNKYRRCFASNLSELGSTSVGEMTITLTNDDPVVYRPYRLAMKEKEVVRDMVAELLENEIVRLLVSVGC